MIQGKWLRPGDPLDLILPLRQIIFQSGSDPVDQEAWNAVIFDNDVPAAIGRIFWKEGVYHLDLIGVDPQRRHKGLGDLVTRLLLFKAQQHAAREISLCCPDDICGFFKPYGFEVTNSQDGQSVMTLDGAVLCLDSCQGCSHKG